MIQTSHASTGWCGRTVRGYNRRDFAVVSYASAPSHREQRMNDRTECAALKKRLDATVLRLTEMIKGDVYENVIVATVRDWFEGNDSVSQLNDNIRANVKKRWPFVERKIEAELLDFQEMTRTMASASQSPEISRLLDERGISEAIGGTISPAIGAIGTALVAMICGGAGTAIIATGPVGLVIGAVAGALAFFFGKSEIEKGMSSFIADKRIPSLIKKGAKGKVSSQLKLNETQFEQQVYDLLREKLKPLYEVIEHGLD